MATEMLNPTCTDNPNQIGKPPRARSWRSNAVVFAIGVALLALAVTAYHCFSQRETDPRQGFEGARIALAAGRVDEAEGILNRLARRNTPTIAERLLRAEVARQRGRFDQALAALDDFSGSDSESALIWRTRGMLEIERDRARPAEAALLQALALNPTLAEARRDLIKLYTMQSRQAELREQFRALASASTLSFDDLYLWSLGRRLDVGPAELAVKLERMWRNEPDNRFVSLALAENLRRLGRLDEAEKALARLPTHDPDGQAARARIALDRGDVAAASFILESGPPNHTALARLRGRLALARGDAEAVGHYRAALAGDPDDRDTLFGLGQALRLAGQADAAAPYLQSARQRDQLEWQIENARSLAQRDQPQVLRKIGDACRSVNRLHEARAWYRLGLARDPADADLQKRLFQLDPASDSQPRS
jgi:tetratricopeptide (TPR) repeat protein